MSDPGWSIAPDWNRWVAIERAGRRWRAPGAARARVSRLSGHGEKLGRHGGEDRLRMTAPFIGVTTSRRGGWRSYLMHRLALAPRRRACGPADPRATRCRRSRSTGSSSAAATISALRFTVGLSCRTCASTLTATRSNSKLLECGAAVRPARARHLPRLADDQRGARRHAAQRHPRDLRKGSAHANGAAAQDGPYRTMRSRLDRIPGCNPCRVNALHHQSVDRFGQRSSRRGARRERHGPGDRDGAAPAS